VEPTLDRSAKVLAQSLVRRLTPVVWAGAQAPFPEVASDDPITLEPGGMISTDQSGEAEVVIEDCLKIYLYQGSELTRSTCRESDQESGLAVCSTAGMISVVNACLNQVVIVQTPNSEIVTTGTEFTVMYVESQDLTVVQVLEGTVAFTPVLSDTGGDTAQPSVDVSQNNMIITTSRDAPTSGSGAGLPEREVLPLNQWETLRNDLTVEDPYIDLWMESTRQITDLNNTRFPRQLARPTGEVTIQMAGTAWTDATLQTLVSESIPWLTFVHELWPRAFVTPKLLFPENAVEDARFLKSNRLTVKNQVGLSKWSRQTITIITTSESTQAADFVKRLSAYLKESGFLTNIEYIQPGEMQRRLLTATRSIQPVMFISLSGDFFE
jgi:hypothetical protein